MTNQPGLKMVLENLKLLFLGAPRAKDSSARQGNKSSTTDTELPLEIGNELLITDDIVKVYRGLSNVRGRVVIIDKIPTNGSRAIKASAFGIQVDVDITEALHMREAYIAREQAAPST